MIPVIMGALLSGPSIMSVQQPELHLHPALQCDLGDYLLSACGNSPKTILLETHSEHLILRLLRRIRETSQGLIPNENCEIRCTPDDLAVLYVDQASDGIRVSNLRVDEQGRFIDEWPEGFFEEGFNEIAGGL
jgi:predicted ATPase